jgi:hypothetical protein
MYMVHPVFSCNMLFEKIVMECTERCLAVVPVTFLAVCHYLEIWCELMFYCWSTNLFKTMWMHFHNKSILKTYSWYQPFIKDCVVRWSSILSSTDGCVSASHWWSRAWLINWSINIHCVCISDGRYTNLSIHILQSDWLWGSHPPPPPPGVRDFLGYL